MAPRTTKKVDIYNPWTNVRVKTMSWNDIMAWALEHVHPYALEEWITYSRCYFDKGEGDILGDMIVGS